MADAEVLYDLVIDLAEREEWEEVRVALVGQHPADVAELISRSPSDFRRPIFDAVDDESQPDVLVEIEERAAVDVLESLTDSELSDLVEEMAPDDAADVIADLPEERSRDVLALMETEESEEVRELLKYDEESAGGIMTPELLAFDEHLTISEALKRIADTDLEEPAYNAYVVDKNEKLVGVIGLWEMLRLKDRKITMGDIVPRDVIAAQVHMDQEEAAKLMSHYDLGSLPVTDENGKLLGRITADDMMDVIEEEASEDIFRMAGSDDSELTYSSPLRASKARLPWLIITLFITFGGSLILKGFMLNLKEVLALSFLVPIVMAMCGSTGMQSSTLVIRSLALRSLEADEVLHLLGREVITGIILGLVCGVLLGLWAQVVVAVTPEPSTFSAFYLGSTAAIALLFAMTFAAVFGSVVPILLNKVHIDPAVASGPFVTASNDIIALLIYYGVTVSMVAMHQALHGVAT